MQSITYYDRTRNKTLLRRLKNIGMASEKLYRNTLNYYYYYLEDKVSLARRGSIVEKWSLKALESSLELEIMEPFNLNSYTGLLLVRREVSSLMVCRVFRELPLD